MLGSSSIVEAELVQKMSGIQVLMMPIDKEKVYNPDGAGYKGWLIDRDEKEVKLIKNRIDRSRKERLMAIDKDRFLESLDSKIEEPSEEKEDNIKQVEKKQEALSWMTYDNDDGITKEKDDAKTFIVKLYEEMEDPYDKCMTIM